MRNLDTLKATLLCGLIFGTLAVGAVMAAEPVATSDAALPHESGVWEKHTYSFAFMGFTSTYSCDGLADKLKQMLITAGARPDSKSQPGPCASPFGRPDRLARADLTFYTLAPADKASSADGAPVNGVWKPVTFTSRQPRYLGLGDCELVDQFRTAVLPMFSTRNVDSHMTCIPHQESGSVIDLKFDVLTVPPPRPRK